MTPNEAIIYIQGALLWPAPDDPRSYNLSQAIAIVKQIVATQAFDAAATCPKCEEWQKAWDEMIRNLGERKAHYAKQKNCAQAVCVLAAATNSMKALDPRRKSEPKKPKFVCPACGWSGDKAGDSIIFTSYDYCPECSHRLSKRPNKPFDWEMGV